MIKYKFNWCFYYLLGNAYRLRFGVNINAIILFKIVLDNRLESHGSFLSAHGRFNNENSSWIRDIHSIEYLEEHHNKPFKRGSRLCSFVVTQIDKKLVEKMNLFGASDTLTEDDIVRNQYLSFPYPAVSKQEIAKERQYYKNKQNATPYNTKFALMLESLNHYLYKGEESFRWVCGAVRRIAMPKSMTLIITKVAMILCLLSQGFRAMIPGGGTDGGVSYLGEQLRQKNSEAVYLDFSKTSMSFSQLKAKIRGGLEIVWVVDWIESFPRLGMGLFNFIGCTGVLHHLKNPQRGLNILSDIQSKNGGAHVMVYGTYGRAAIYQIQNLLQIIKHNDHNLKDEVKSAKVIVKILPDEHWFRHFQFLDFHTMGDIGIYDTLLHKRDVSYTIPDFYEWVQQGGYKFVDHSLPENRLPLSLRFRINDNVIFSKLVKMRISLQEAISEILVGSIFKQNAYVSKMNNSEAIIYPGKSVVFAHGSPAGFRHVMNDPSNFIQYQKKSFVVATLARNAVVDTSKNDEHHSLTRPVTHGTFIWPDNDFNNFIITELTKKPNRKKDLITLIRGYNAVRKSNITTLEGSMMFSNLFSYLKTTGVFYVKHKLIPDFHLTCCSHKYSILGHGRDFLHMH